jgi:hypothetical protein
MMASGMVISQTALAGQNNTISFQKAGRTKKKVQRPLDLVLDV